MADSALFPLRDLRILIAEDEYLLAAEMADMLERRGAIVLGPISTVTDALRLATGAVLDGAVLDVNLRGEMIWPVADILLARQVPMVFATGYGQDCAPKRHSRAPWVSKPIIGSELTKRLTDCSRLVSAGREWDASHSIRV